jgi:hypothetical protein
MRRAILPMSVLLMAASLAGCSETGASGGPPPPDATVGQPGPQASAMPPGASDEMKKSLHIKPKKAANAQPGQVPH